MDRFEEALATATEKDSPKAAHSVIVAAIYKSGKSEIKILISNIYFRDGLQDLRQIYLQKASDYISVQPDVKPIEFGNALVMVIWRKTN
jgi:hypothetical protein